MAYDIETNGGVAHYDADDDDPDGDQPALELPEIGAIFIDLRMDVDGQVSVVEGLGRDTLDEWGKVSAITDFIKRRFKLSEEVSNPFGPPFSPA